MAAIEYRGINAVTNFDWNNYMAWLKPPPPPSSTPNNAHMASDPNKELCNSNSIPAEEPSLFKNHHYDVDSFHSLQKQALLESCSAPLNGYTKSSSPSALDLLLRSSFFKKLVETNSSLSMEEADNGEEAKTRAQLDSVFDEFGDIFCDRLTDVPLVCSSNKGLKESELNSYFNGTFHGFKAA